MTAFTKARVRSIHQGPQYLTHTDGGVSGPLVAPSWPSSIVFFHALLLVIECRWGKGPVMETGNIRGSCMFDDGLFAHKA